jgi:hypothetical protein
MAPPPPPAHSHLRSNITETFRSSLLVFLLLMRHADDFVVLLIKDVVGGANLIDSNKNVTFFLPLAA